MSALLTYMLRAGLGLAAFFVLYAVFLRGETHFRLNRLVLVGGLLLSFLIPAFPVASPFRVAAAEGPSLPWLPAAVAAPSIGLADILAAVYAAGVLLFLARFGGHLLRLGLVVRRRGVRRFHGLRIVTVEREFSPFSFLGLVFVNIGGFVGNAPQVVGQRAPRLGPAHGFPLDQVGGHPVALRIGRGAIEVPGALAQGKNHDAGE